MPKLKKKSQLQVALKDKERKKNKNVHSHQYSPLQLIALIGDSSTEIPDDIIEVALNLMRANCDATTAEYIGYYTPAELHLLASQSQTGSHHFDSKDLLPNDRNSINIHPLTGHWVTSFYRASTKSICVYDSLMSTAHKKEVISQLEVMYGKNEARNIQYTEVTQQTSEPICGVMAVAFAFACFLHQDPTSINFNIKEARHHLIRCISTGEVKAFPSIPIPRATSSKETCIIFNQESTSVSDKDHTMSTDISKHRCIQNYFASQANLLKRHLEKRSDATSGMIDNGHESLLKTAKTKGQNIRRKSNQRQHQLYRSQERQKDKKARKIKRLNKEERFSERQRDRNARQLKRLDLTKRLPERRKEQDLKRKQRLDVDFRLTERKKEKKARQKQRLDSTKRLKERQNDKKSRQTKRSDPTKRLAERKKEKKARQKQRLDSTKRLKERQNDKKSRQTKRSDPTKRLAERKKEKKARQKQRLDSTKRLKERQNDKKSRQTKRSDPTKRLAERKKEKKARQKQRLDPTKRLTERQRDMKSRQTKRLDPMKRLEERKREKKTRQIKRLDPTKRKTDRQKDKNARQTKRLDPTKRLIERRKEKQCKQKSRVISNIAQAIELFHVTCQEMPCYSCCICCRLFFRKQVIKYKMSKYPGQSRLHDCIAASNLHETSSSCVDDCNLCAKWACITCHRSLLHNNVPKQASLNNLHLPPCPPSLQSLNQLEKHIVSPIIPFMKIVTLPKGLQKGIHGPVVCVPSNISQITKTLPRPLNDHTLIKVKLKRKMEYRGHHLFQQVSVSKIYAALQYLKATNPHFKDINLDLDQLHTDDADEASILKADEPDQFATDIGHTAGNEVTIADEQQTTTVSEIIHSQDESSHELHSKNIATETDNTTSDLHDSSTPMVSCLQPEDLANEICNNVVGSLYYVAPAEGNRPSSVFDMEMKAFPYLFPEGKNGFQEQRHHKLGLSRYFNSRLFNVDARFASDPQYIFFSQYANELNQITNSISIAMRKTTGKGRDGKEITAAMLTDAVKRKEIIKSNEGYHFLKTVRGTPAYWEKTLRDLFAMVKQLGTPTWFCSFSAADRRWPEIVKAICRQQGKDPPPDMDWSTYSKLINSNPVTACRMFEHRVQSFISNIILSSACPIGNVVDYFYRTEFQSRGWPHIHCLFWCQNAPKFTPGDPNNKDFIEYIDQYVTCAVPDEELPLHDIVTSVQMHSKSHSPSCKKRIETVQVSLSETTFRQNIYCHANSSS